ncbi:MAG: ABC transporter permease [Hydrogeniiclostridium mannosilyticum]
MFLMILVTGAPVTPYLLLIPVPLILLLIFTTGLSLALSITGVFFRDMTHLYSIITTVWMYATPIFYPISIIPQQYRFIWDLNPLYHYITMMRDLVLYRMIPSQQTLFIATCYSLLMLVTGILVFKKYQDRIYTHL